MRILHVNKFLHRRGGAEAHMLDVATLQRAGGHEVALFGMQHPDNPPLPFEQHFPGYLELDPLPRTTRDRARAFARMVYSTSARRGMAHVLEGFRPDVVHLHNIYHQLSPSILQPVAAQGIPTVMTLHDYKLACPTYQFLDQGRLCDACVDGGLVQAVRRRCRDGSVLASSAAALELSLHRLGGAYDAVDRFLCPSKFLADKMRAAGVHPGRMQVLNNFVDATAIPTKDQPGGPVVFAGRLAPEKAVDTLIRAVGCLPGVRLDVAGDGPERAALERLAGHVAPGRVHFHGRLPAPELFGLLACSVVAAVPSRWYENQPLAVLEAFAAGVPVVATALGGIPELVDPDRTGVLVPPDDVSAMADALAGLTGDPLRALVMGRRARREVMERFTPEVYLANVQRHYAEVMNVTAVR